MKKISLVLVIFICLFSNGCGDIEINSQWRKQNIVIDGNDSDWGNSLVPSGKINASVGIVNDSEYLYICLSTMDPEVENKILGAGLTLWFQGSDNSNNKFGVCYPMGMRGNSMPPSDENIRPGDGVFDPSKMLETLLKSETSVELINGNNDTIKIPVSELKDIHVKVALNDGKLVYELKMPLNQKHSTTYALNAGTGSTIRVSIESGTTNRNGFMPPGGGFGMPPGGDEGPGGGFGGGSNGNGFPPPGGMGRGMF